MIKGYVVRHMEVFLKNIGKYFARTIAYVSNVLYLCIVNPGKLTTENNKTFV